MIIMTSTPSAAARRLRALLCHASLTSAPSERASEHATESLLLEVVPTPRRPAEWVHAQSQSDGGVRPESNRLRAGQIAIGDGHTLMGKQGKFDIEWMRSD